MILRRKKSIYDLQNDNGRFSVVGELSIEEGRAEFNGSVRSMEHGERGYTAFYREEDNGNVSFSQNGCPRCEVAAQEFLFATIADAKKHPDGVVPPAEEYSDMNEEGGDV